MKSQFPTATGYSGITLVGQRKAPHADTAQLLGVFVLKRYYRIAGGQLLPEPDHVGIRLSDEMVSFSHSNLTYSTASYQADIVVYKPQADLIVRNHYAVGDSCSVEVTAPADSTRLWLARSGTVGNNGETGQPEPDLLHYMFGWENRGLAPRRQQAAVKVNNDPPEFEPPAQAPVFDNGFFNSYRRNFAKPPYPAQAFSPGSQIRISRSSHSTLQFQLGNEQISAQLWLADGKSPDKQHYWCRHHISDIRADTLVVSPAEQRAYMLWRGIWPYQLYPATQYRQLDVKAQEHN